MFISGKEIGLQHGWLGKFTPGSIGSHSTGSEPVAATLEKRFGQVLVKETCRVQAEPTG